MKILPVFTAVSALLLNLLVFAIDFKENNDFLHTTQNIKNPSIGTTDVPSLERVALMVFDDSASLSREKSVDYDPLTKCGTYSTDGSIDCDDILFPFAKLPLIISCSADLPLNSYLACATDEAIEFIKSASFEDLKLLSEDLENIIRKIENMHNSSLDYRNHSILRSLAMMARLNCGKHVLNHILEIIQSVKISNYESLLITFSADYADFILFAIESADDSSWITHALDIVENSTLSIPKLSDYLNFIQVALSHKSDSLKTNRLLSIEGNSIEDQSLENCNFYFHLEQLITKIANSSADPYSNNSCKVFDRATTTLLDDQFNDIDSLDKALRLFQAISGHALFSKLNSIQSLLLAKCSELSTKFVDSFVSELVLTIQSQELYCNDITESLLDSLKDTCFYAIKALPTPIIHEKLVLLKSFNLPKDHSSFFAVAKIIRALEIQLQK